MKTVLAGPLRERLRQRVDDDLPLRVILREARRAGVDAYLVGGPVRDLLLRVPILDLDVLLSGGLRRVAGAVARRLRGRLRVHPRFLTATVSAPCGRIDFSRARREHYARPGALPDVVAGSIDADLARRDFSVNAMALPLDERCGSRLLDPFGGQRDLDRGELRVLHAASFEDDPTRLLRAARYAGRLRFRLAADTRRLARAALVGGALRTVSRDRIRHEIHQLLEDTATARAADWTDRLGLFEAIAPGWRLTARARRALRRLEAARNSPLWPEVHAAGVNRASGLRLLLADAPSAVRRAAAAALGLDGRHARNLLADLDGFPALGRALDRELSRGGLDARLGSLDDAALLALYCLSPSRAAGAVRLYAGEIRRLPDPLDGHVARALGARGPEVGALLRLARRRALDGRSVGARWARRWLARRRQMG